MRLLRTKACCAAFVASGLLFAGLAATAPVGKEAQDMDYYLAEQITEDKPEVFNGDKVMSGIGDKDFVLRQHHSLVDADSGPLNRGYHPYAWIRSQSAPDRVTDFRILSKCRLSMEHLSVSISPGMIDIHLPTEYALHNEWIDDVLPKDWKNTEPVTLAISSDFVRIVDDSFAAAVVTLVKLSGATTLDMSKMHIGDASAHGNVLLALARALAYERNILNLTSLKYGIAVSLDVFMSAMTTLTRSSVKEVDIRVYGEVHYSAVSNKEVHIKVYGEVHYSAVSNLHNVICGYEMTVTMRMTEGSPLVVASQSLDQCKSGSLVKSSKKGSNDVDCPAPRKVSQRFLEKLGIFDN